MKTAFVSLLAFALLQGTERPDLSEMVPTVIEAVEEIVCRTARFGDGCGPLLVDVQSFATAVQEASSIAVSEAQIEAKIGRPYSDVSAREAHGCAPAEYPCMILHEGVHVQMDSLTRTTGCTWEAVVTFSWSGRKGQDVSPAGFHRVKLNIENQRGKWVVTGGRVIMAT